MRIVTSVRAVPHLRGGRIDLTWSLPPTSDFAVGRRLGGVVVVRRERTFPRDHTDGDVVYTGPPISAISDGGLAPQRTYYYTVYAREENETGPPEPIWLADQRSQASALATSDFGSTAKLYGLLPGVHQSRDIRPTKAELAQLAVDKPALAATLAALPPDIHGTGQLRRFVRAAGAPLDLMRSTAEALPQLHDVDNASPEFLPLLARWLGWDVDTTLAVHEQRNEIKFAPRLYRKVGTIDSLRRLVARYTGWYTRAAEMDQALLRSNQPPQLHLYATAETGAEWLGTDDASVVLGFGPANRSATGADGSPGSAAELTGSVTGPFALRPGMELTVAVDGRLPTTIRFAPGDFADMAAATADEVAAALRRTFTQLRPPPVPLPGGRLVLTSNLLGAASSLEVLAASASLVSLDGAPRGRIAAFGDASGRRRMFFAAADPLEPARTEAARATLRGEQPVVGPVPGESTAPDPRRGRPPVLAGQRATDRLYVKTWVDGQWQAARPVVELAPAPQSDPAAAALGAGIVCAWVEEPATSASKLRFATGTPNVAQRATLSGRRSAPFVIEPGMRLVFGGRWRATEGIELARSELPLPFGPQRLTAAQVVNLLAPHLVHVTASVGPRNTIVFSTIAAGGDERLELDLATSTAAEALGFGPDNAAATGDWGDAIDWAPAADVAGLGPTDMPTRSRLPTRPRVCTCCGRATTRRCGESQPRASTVSRGRR